MKRFLTYIFLALLSVPVWAAESDSTYTAAPDSTSAVAPASAATPKIEYGMTRKTYEIAGISVTGAPSYEDFVLIGFSGLAVGDKIEVPGDQITKSIKRFWKQGLFSDVKIAATKIEGDKIWLEIRLKQRPRVSEIKYNGLKKSEQEDVEVKVGISKGSQMTPNLADRAKTVVKKYLEEKGFHNADIQVLQQPDRDREGYVKVLVNVDKKAKTKVGKIYITGNRALTHTQQHSEPVPHQEVRHRRI